MKNVYHMSMKYILMKKWQKTKTMNFSKNCIFFPQIKILIFLSKVIYIYSNNFKNLIQKINVNEDDYFNFIKIIDDDYIKINPIK